MENPLKVIGSSGTGCGTCKPTGCGSCGTEPPKTETSVSSQSTGVRSTPFWPPRLARYLQDVRQKRLRKQPAHHLQKPLRLRLFLPDLAVVQSSKGPIMTTLEEFYKMGPGPSQLPHHGPDENFRHVRFLPTGF